MRGQQGESGGSAPEDVMVAALRREAGRVVPALRKCVEQLEKKSALDFKKEWRNALDTHTGVTAPAAF